MPLLAIRASGLLLALPLVAALGEGTAAAAHPAVAGGLSCGAAGCHEGIARAGAGGSAHEPAAGGECEACHDLGRAAAAALLRASAAEPEGDRALCGPCHGDHAASAADPAVRTAFADGARDLHGVHVRAAGRGPACLGCHAPHAGPQARLLRAEIPGRGTVRITQRFEARPDGGRCVTRCHAPKEYRR